MRVIKQVLKTLQQHEMIFQTSLMVSASIACLVLFAISLDVEIFVFALMFSLLAGWNISDAFTMKRINELKAEIDCARETLQAEYAKAEQLRKGLKDAQEALEIIKKNSFRKKTKQTNTKNETKD